MNRIFSLVATALILISAIAAAPGTAVASHGEYNQSFTDGADRYNIDFGSYTGVAHITIHSSEAPTDGGVIYAETVNVDQMDGTTTRFLNNGAYQNLTISVTGPSSSPTFTSGDTSKLTPYREILIGTGGDADMQCSVAEELKQFTLGIPVVDCAGSPGTAQFNSTGLSTTETKIGLYEDSASLNQSNEDFHAVMSNNIEDSYGPARQKGLAAYVDAVNNNATQAEAEAAAIDAVNSYYAVRQKNLVARWNTNYYKIASNRDTAEATSNVASDYPATLNITGTSYDYAYAGAWRHAGTSGVSTFTNETLVNGNNTKAARLVIDYLHGSNSGTVDIHPSSITVADHGPAPPVQVQSYNSTSVDAKTYLRPGKFHSQWNSIQSANSQVESDMQTIASNTYADLSSGELNSSDLLTAQTLASEYSAEGEFDTWAYAHLTAIGANSPETFETTGQMNVSYEDGTHEMGLLMSSSTPVSGEFAVGHTYNPDNLAGSQFLVGTDSITRIEQNFTLESAQTTNGTSLNNVTYQETTYVVSNTSELRETFNRTQEDRVEFEARHSNIFSGGGGALLGGSSGIGVLVVLGGALYLMFVKDDKGGAY